MTEENSFREQMLDARPEIADREKAYPRKQAIAMKLRALRDARGMTQTDVAEASGLSRSVVVRMESLIGPVPKLEAIFRYVTACKGQMALLISADAIDLPTAALTW